MAAARLCLSLSLPHYPTLGSICLCLCLLVFPVSLLLALSAVSWCLCLLSPRVLLAPAVSCASASCCLQCVCLFNVSLSHPVAQSCRILLPAIGILWVSRGTASPTLPPRTTAAINPPNKHEQQPHPINTKQAICSTTLCLFCLLLFKANRVSCCPCLCCICFPLFVSSGLSPSL